jgi:hypothetical protein
MSPAVLSCGEVGRHGRESFHHRGFMIPRLSFCDFLQNTLCLCEQSNVVRKFLKFTPSARMKERRHVHDRRSDRGVPIVNLRRCTYVT